VGASVNLAGYLGLVGRDTELRQLAAALEASVETGAESTLLVRGEAGIGEARLSEAAAELAAARGFRTHRPRLVDAGGQVAGAIPALLIRELLGLTQGEDEWRTRAAVKAASADPDLSLFLCVSEGSAHRAEAGLFLALLQREMGEIAAACRVLGSVIAGCGDEQVFCDAHIELAGALLVQDRYAEALAHLDAAANPAEALGDDARLARPHYHRGLEVEARQAGLAIPRDRIVVGPTASQPPSARRASQTASKGP
jgi:hypothetical protein